MLTDVLNSSSVLRLKEILQNRYGTGLRVDRMIEASSIVLTSQAPSLVGGALRIPISFKGEYLATAYVEKASQLTELDQIRVTDLVQMVLEPLFYKWHVDTVEARAPMIEILNSDKVVPLFKHIDLSEDEETRRSISSFILFLHSKNPFLVNKVAMQIHDITNNWALLRWTDIRSEVKNSWDIINLGGVTLFVEDILMLSFEEQQMIEQAAAATDVSNPPLILIGANSELKDLTSPLMVEEKLLRKLKDHVLEVDRLPQDFARLRESLEMLLDTHIE